MESDIMSDVMRADIVIKNGMVLTMDRNLTLHEKADVAITGSKIVDISSRTKYTGRRIIDARNKLVMPGLINTHTHAAMTLLRGIADDLPLDIWWQKYIFPIEKKFGNKEFIEIGVSLAAIEMIKSGTTSFADMYFYEDVAAEACKKIGIRSFLGEGILDFPTPSCNTPDESIKYTEKLHKKWKDDPIIHLMVAPHAPYTCSPPVLEKAKALADKLDIPLHIHVAETATEIADIKSRYGVSPVEHLEEIEFLSDRVIAVHSVHLGPKDINIFKKYNVKVAHCPESNMKLTSGNALVVKMINEGITVGLGTDGAASNNNLDMFGEMDSAAKIHKAVWGNPTVMNAKEVLRSATSEAAKVMQKSDIGSLEAGKTADIILVDLAKPHLTPLYNVYSHLVYSASGSDVDTVIINGKIVMRNRRILGINEKEVIARANEIAEKIKAEVKNA